MKITYARLPTSLVLLLSLGFACAQSPSRPKTNWESRGQSWLTNYFGKTLSSLGEIVSVKVETSSNARTSSTNRTHTAVWRVIERSKMQDYYSMGVALDIPPLFAIEYADGSRVRASRYAASIKLPDGREGLLLLAEDSANPQGGADGRQPFSSHTNRTSAAAASRRSP
jgi:hypothetical protein